MSLHGLQRQQKICLDSLVTSGRLIDISWLEFLELSVKSLHRVCGKQRKPCLHREKENFQKSPLKKNASTQSCHQKYPRLDMLGIMQ